MNYIELHLNYDLLKIRNQNLYFHLIYLLIFKIVRILLSSVLLEGILSLDFILKTLPRFNSKYSFMLSIFSFL